MGNQEEINKFDDFLREQMSDYSAQPPSGVFSSIEQSVTQGGSVATTTAGIGKIMIKTLIIATTAVGIGGAGYYILTKPTDKKSNIETGSVSEKQNSISATEEITKNEQPEEVNESPSNMEQPTQNSIPKNLERKQAAPADPSNNLATERKNEGWQMADKANQNITPTNNQNTAIVNRNSNGNTNKPNSNSNSKIYSQPKAMYTYEWLDEQKLSVTNHSRNTEHVLWLFNGKPAEIKTDDHFILSFEKEEIPEQLSIVAFNGNYTDTFTRIVEPPKEETPIIPDVFTPDGDGYNDTYTISIGASANYFIQISDASGKLIFTGKEWDGNIDGRPAEAGYYQAVISYQTVHMKTQKIKVQRIKLFRK